MQVYHWIEFVQSLLHPACCPCCGTLTRSRRAFCEACYAELPFNDHACPRCSLQLPAEAPPGTLCGRCLQRSPPYQRGFSALTYQPPVSQLISGLKFRRQLHLVRPLAQLMVERLGDIHPLPEMLIPVPLHPQRLRERGFNQSLELARSLADQLDMELDWRSCRRVRATPAQSGLSEKARRQNLRGAFQVERRFAGRHLVLFDDVITTGATLAELSRILLAAGAVRVDVWALARTPMRSRP